MIPKGTYLILITHLQSVFLQILHSYNLKFPNSHVWLKISDNVLSTSLSTISPFAIFPPEKTFRVKFDPFIFLILYIQLTSLVISQYVPRHHDTHCEHKDEWGNVSATVGCPVWWESHLSK